MIDPQNQGSWVSAGPKLVSAAIGLVAAIFGGRFWMFMIKREDGRNTAAGILLGERTANDAVTAALISRQVAEIVDLNKKIKALEFNRDEGWRGLERCHEIARNAIHQDAERMMTITRILGDAGLTMPELPQMPVLPSINALAGRKVDNQ